ncbi:MULTISPECIES: hypothetical protein [unclassified Nostoc]|nr:MULTISPECIES: hypothetical protein [unclassified Nostoc]MBE8988083.1 hypothetical protein [Nostoc sp. LEGE 12450]QHG20912.1 hypothetical protein GJB62_34075 [Nostoc sp. ATCC 53789]QHG20987.1 hypothetical protein GJB62_34605 [Nostoc sp. ATCC 53789]
MPVQGYSLGRIASSPWDGQRQGQQLKKRSRCDRHGTSSTNHRNHQGH